MPMMPNEGETEKDFMSRCMSHEMGKEGMKNDQASAICHSKWRDKDKKKAAVDISDVITCSGTFSGATSQETDMSMINMYSVPGVTLKVEDVFVRSMYLVNDQIAYGNHVFRLSMQALTQAAKMIPGAPVIQAHDRNSLPLARFFKAVVEEKDGVNWLRAWFYWPKDVSCGADIAKNIDAGVLKEVSIGLLPKNETTTCSICEKPMGSKTCFHNEGQEYDGKVCYLAINDVKKVMEGSLVYRGGAAGTSMTLSAIERKDMTKDDGFLNKLITAVTMAYKSMAGDNGGGNVTAEMAVETNKTEEGKQDMAELELKAAQEKEAATAALLKEATAKLKAASDLALEAYASEIQAKYHIPQDIVAAGVVFAKKLPEETLVDFKALIDKVTQSAGVLAQFKGTVNVPEEKLEIKDGIGQHQARLIKGEGSK